MSTLPRLFAGMVLPATLMSACSAELAIPQPPLPVVPACFVTEEEAVPVMLELAEDYTQRQLGLMARSTLAENTGMLFIYQQRQSADHGFWMYKTLLYLDIAYLDDQGIIGSIRKMAPCSSENPGNCPVYPAGFEFTQAVEMNEGFFADNNIATGDQLITGKPGCHVD